MKEKTKRKFKLFIKVACGLLSLLLLVATILFFPLKGKSHIEVWAASDEFDINTIQSIEKTAAAPLKFYSFPTPNYGH